MPRNRDYGYLREQPDNVLELMVRSASHSIEEQQAFRDACLMEINRRKEAEPPPPELFSVENETA